MPTLVVTGATGNIGRSLTERLLAQRGASVRVLARTGARAEPLREKGAEVRVGDLGSSAFLAEALRDADAAFLMVPPKYDAADVKREQRSVARSLVDAVGDSRVPRLVVLSSVGAEVPSGTGPIEVLHDFEAWLKAVPGRSVTALRPTFFMENHLTAIPAILGTGAMAGGLSPDLSIPMIATKDIAAAAAEELVRTSPTGWSVRYLLGPGEHTHRQVARTLGSAIGKSDLRYVQVAPEALREALLAMGLSPSVAAAYLEMNRAMEDGRILAAVRRDAGSTTPTTLDAWARETFAPAYRAARPS